MKYGWMSFLFWGVLISQNALASGTVCSNETTYYSIIRKDFGTPPPVGTETGRVTILHDGKVLLDYTSIQGLHPQGIPPYQLRFVDKEEVLYQEGTPTSGARVFKRKGLLKKFDPLTHQEIETLVEGKFLCRTTWAMVP